MPFSNDAIPKWCVYVNVIYIWRYRIYLMLKCVIQSSLEIMYNGVDELRMIVDGKIPKKSSVYLLNTRRASTPLSKTAWFWMKQRLNKVSCDCCLMDKYYHLCVHNVSTISFTMLHICPPGGWGIALLQSLLNTHNIGPMIECLCRLSSNRTWTLLASIHGKHKSASATVEMY